MATWNRESVAQSSTDTYGDVTITGDVGIATTTPASPLEIKRTDTGDYITFDHNGTDVATIECASNRLSLNGIASGSVVINQDAIDVDFQVKPDTGHGLFLEGSSGKVGIGTITPSTNLHIYDDTDNVPNIYLENVDSDSNSGGNVIFRVQDSNGDLVDNQIVGDLVWQGYNNSKSGGAGYDNMALIRGRVDGTPDGSDADMPGELAFYTCADNGALSQRLTIRADGKVGIGTTVPAADLEIYASTGDALLRLATTTASASDDAIIEIVTDVDGTPRQARIGVDHSDNTLKLIHGTSFSGGTNGICIDSSGKVGIGTAAPSTPLHVVGNATITGVVTSGVTYTQYFGISDINMGTAGYHYIMNNGMMNASPVGGDSSALGNGTDPATTLDFSAITDGDTEDIIAAYWYVPINCTITEVKALATTDGTTSETLRFHVMQYDLDTSSQHGDLANGVLKAHSADIASLTAASLKVGAFTLDSADLTAGKIVIVTIEADDASDKISAQVFINYKAR